MASFLNKITKGSCVDLLPQLEDSSVDLCIIDPPYNIEGGGGEGGLRSGIFYRNTGGRKLFNYEKAENYMTEIARILKPSSHLYVFSNDKNLEDILIAGKNAGFKLMNVLVLDKGNKVAFGWYMKQVEFVLLFRKIEGKAKQVNDMSVPNLIKVYFPKGKNRVHPSEKSIDLVELFINQSSKENDVVLDCFIGSGTTAIASIKTGRKYIGFELNEEYWKLANERIEKVRENLPYEISKLIYESREMEK